MTVASKSPVSNRHTQITSRAKSQNVRILENSRSSPLWLRQMRHLQHSLSAIACLSVTTMLAVYGWTVYSEKMWNQAYHQLQTLQLYERQLMSTNEVLKNKLALQAQQPDMGFVPPNPAQAIVLQPASEHSTQVTKSKLHPTQPAVPISNITQLPLGY